ncbi:hypothetical protein D3C77_588620 [compost metagenome]
MLQPTRRFEQRLAPPQQEHHRDGRDDHDPAPAVIAHGHNEVAQQRRQHEAKREEARQRTREAATVFAADEFRQIRRNDGAFRAHADARDHAQNVELVIVASEGVDERGHAEQHQGPHHDLLAAVAVAQNAREQRAHQKAHVGAAGDPADLAGGQAPLRAQRRDDEGDDAGVQRFKRQAQAADQ